MKVRIKMTVLFLILVSGGCSSDGSPTDPGVGKPGPPSHYEVSLKMSSITAVADCEATPGNPGDFRYTLQVTREDELDNRITFGTIGPHDMSVGDGSTLGATSEPLRFLMVNEPGATFQVEYWLGEYDPAADLEVHGWVNHVLDRDSERLWRAGTDWTTYNDTDPAESYGILKFAVWNTRGDCKGFANYIVRWSPVWR